MRKNIVIAVSILLVGIVVGLLCRPKGCPDTTIIQRDTTYVRDTHTVEKPVPVAKVVKDTMLLVVKDTIRIKDTLYITLPRETKTYKGEEYCAEISGYKPSLDRIEVYPKTEIITETRREVVRQKNYLSAGTEVGYVDNCHLYIYAEYERMLHKNVGFYGRILHDIPSGCNGVSIGIKAQLGW